MRKVLADANETVPHTLHRSPLSMIGLSSKAQLTRQVPAKLSQLNRILTKQLALASLNFIQTIWPMYAATPNLSIQKASLPSLHH
jgi:hypothetical protein